MFSYHKYSNLRIFVFLPILFLLLSLTAIPTVSASWTETFSTDSLTNWELSALELSQQDGIYVTIPTLDHGWYVEDGELKSDGRIDDTGVIYQKACRKYQDVLTVLTLDVYNAPNWVYWYSDDTFSGWGLQIGRDLFSSDNSSQTYTPGYFFVFYGSFMDWVYYPDPDVQEDELIEELDVVYLRVTSTLEQHSYEISFLERSITFGMDGELFYTNKTSHSEGVFETFNTICLISQTRSADIFDNVTLQVEPVVESRLIGFSGLFTTSIFVILWLCALRVSKLRRI